MASCEMCGEATAFFEGFIEGSKLLLCNACKGYATMDSPLRLPETRSRDAQEQKPEKTLNSSYGVLIKKARERRGLEQAETAKKLRVSTNVLRRVENAKLVPDEELTGRLENFFNIALMVRADTSYKPSGKQSGALTFADAIKLRRKETNSA